MMRPVAAGFGGTQTADTLTYCQQSRVLSLPSAVMHTGCMPRKAPSNLIAAAMGRPVNYITAAYSSTTKPAAATSTTAAATLVSAAELAAAVVPAVPM